MDQVQIEMALDKNYLLPDKTQKAYLMVKLTAPELVGTKTLVVECSPDFKK
ncbi:hypothetical protein [Desulfosporosinus metallidurans]|uniref:Uncharacterized protein n=1 Tax=Desulfosporosinus metallidurans TaxID=1888891 RepID=A0A1Q8QP35_9FIRM|nr:hypothetical protein [Desulfosporosinus metallidurans]OLN29062.1 hypothetical protein DSOL_3723 [Desulfosporosinus metallidurans]